MGMYTKFRIDLNIFSIAAEMQPAKMKQLEDLLECCKQAFLIQHIGRPQVCLSTTIVSGLNGCVNLYGHGEIKNYDHDIESWYKTLTINFPQAEGSLYIQYEEDDFPTFILFSHGMYTRVIPTSIFEGYGNNSEMVIMDRKEVKKDDHQNIELYRDNR